VPRNPRRLFGKEFSNPTSPTHYAMSLIVLTRSCSCRWGPCPSLTPRLACPFYLFIYTMRERSPVLCAQPSPRGDAPSPLAFAKSCKGGDVSVLDPALAWDVRCIYLFIGTGTGLARTGTNTGERILQPVPRTTLGTGLARTGTNTGTPDDKEKHLMIKKKQFSAM